MTTPLYIDRPPRIQPELPIEEINIPPPPDKREQSFARLIQVGLPLLTIIGYVLIGTLGGVRRNPLFLIPMALSVVASVCFSIYSYFQEKKQQAEAAKAYEERLAELNKEMQNYHDLQRRFYRYNYPDVQTTIDIVYQAYHFAKQHPHKLRIQARLWERRTSDDDFGVIRLGMGTLPSTVTYILDDVDDFDDPQVRAATKLAEDSLFVIDIPVILSLRPPKEDEMSEENESEVAEIQHNRTPAAHALGIAGDSRAVRDFARFVVTQYAVFHAPADARLYLLSKHCRPWVWVDELPHSQGGKHEQFTCFLDDLPDASVNDEDDEGPVANFLEGIRKILAQRTIRLQDNDQKSSESDPTLPLMLLVVDLLDTAYDDRSLLSLDKLEKDAAISILLDSGARLGAAVIFLVPDRSKIPGNCQGVIEVERTTPATNNQYAQSPKLHYRYAEVGVNSFRYVGQADYFTEEEIVKVIEKIAKQMARLKIRQSAGSGLTSSVPFMDLMGFASLDDLRTKSWARWQATTRPEKAAWLQVKVGRMSGNKPRKLIFSAKKDGVHGLVAGSTGSGKSELLISMIIGMAVNYDPSVLNFVLVDYKGGGAFNEFRKLPHCVDIITNLQGDGVTRMFTAINSEMKRRQALNANTETKNIVDYRQKGLHHKEPYPYLFIIIDEFAEMIADRPEYKAELESITRVGRAQGVSLILAAQQPTGVTDQMRSNIKFRICLRVETPGASREMLRRSEAAFLPSDIPGRGYLQIGNEEIELIQVAYTGERYDPTQPLDAKVIWPERHRNGTKPDKELPELYKVIIETLRDIADEYDVTPQYAPWPEVLPRNLALSHFLISENKDTPTITSEKYLRGIDRIMLGQQPEATLTLNPSLNKWITGENGWLTNLDWKNYALRPLVGLMDNPYEAQQLPLVIDFQRGHAVIFGGSGWGKTTFLKSLMLSLVATHSPNNLHIYILDLGGRSFKVFETMPHVGAVIMPDEEGYKERVEQLLRMLENLIEKRKTTFSDVGVAEFIEYNRHSAQQPLPSILVIIDNFIEFRESFGSSKDNVETSLDKLILIARESRRYGVHFVLSVNQFNVLPNPLFNLFTERLTLKLADPSEYRAIVGGQVADIDDIAGRGYMKVGALPLTVQIAQPLDPHNDLDETRSEKDVITEIADKMNKAIRQLGPTYNKPETVDALPKSVLYKHMLARELGVETDEQFLQHLREYARTNWQASLDPEKADWLQVGIGVISGNRLRPMYLEAKRDGVHGLIAGGTGSGKSELLMTLIVGLALRYDPSVLNFVLVDYKGGGAFQPFAELPHCVDIVTNLNKSAVRRMFTAINAEMQRRQKLNADTDTSNIVEYRAKGFHQKHKPYPHLFIIIDEYAEMITDSPQFRDELDSITRLGRAQGINLLLASQRPTGVSDQMRANIKFRICLRVEGIDTSREMLRRSDAAFLPNGMPGRGYLQVGNENIELMQVAYTGEEYPHVPINEKGQQPKFFNVVVGLAKELHQTAPLMTPWPPPLPKTLTLAPAVSRTQVMQRSANDLQRMLTQYFDQEYLPFIKLGQRTGLGQPDRLYALNPAVQDWLAGKPAWPGVNWNKTAMRAVVGLVDDPYNARLLPLLIDLTRGHAVLFGSSGWGKTTFLRTLVVSLAATHSPDEFQCHILDLGGRNLIVLQELPHVGSVIMPDERGYEEQVQQLLRKLNEIVDDRKTKFGTAKASTLYAYNQKVAETKPAILIIIDNFAEFIETFGNMAQQDREDGAFNMLVVLMRQAKAYGIHFVITADRVNVLSSKLYSLFTERLTLKLSDASEYSIVVSGRMPDLEEIYGRGYVRFERQPLAFQIAVAVGEFNQDGQLDREFDLIEELGTQMKSYWGDKNKPFQIGALPQSSLYRQILAKIFDIDNNELFWDELPNKVNERWQKNGTAEEADWLQVVLGIVSGNQRRTLHLEAKEDGVHGMIAGGTGSGKSELLMTMIVGLALNYSPDILNFVLVDYKGGGAFKPFASMPHCVDMISNLNTAGVDRMFAAINAEMRHRQALNTSTGTKDIVEYREKGHHLNGGQPYPHLFIIIDEYAEMIDENPDYRAQLESITRVGRAQGVNLILASQRPKGVSDQMRANIKLRICLRVEQTETSRELLRRPDAATLPSIPGRGYIQVGNEHLELIQVSWAGETIEDKFEAAVNWPDRVKHQTGQADEEPPKLFEKVVELTSELYHRQMARKPWPNFLPQIFSLQSSLVDAMRNETFTLLPVVAKWTNGDIDGLWPGIDWQQEAARPVVGLFDNPAAAEQKPLYFDFRQNHLAIFGDAGMGKSSLIRTIITSLAATHSPNEFHTYTLDLGGRTLQPLERLPHVGAVIYADDEKYEERQERLLNRLARMIEARQQKFSEAGVDDLYDYNARHPDQSLPMVVVAINNFAELRENYEMLVDNTITPLIRRSLKSGIAFVVTTNMPNNLSGKLYNLFGERITLKQSNPDLYLDIVGRGTIPLDDIPGRGYIRQKKRPLQFQLALSVGLFDEETKQDNQTEAEELQRIGRFMTHYATSSQFSWREKPDPIPALPAIVPLPEMLTEATPPTDVRIEAVLGKSGQLQPALFDLRRLGPHFAVVGPPLSGKTTTLYNWIISLTERYPPERIKMVLVDLQRKLTDYGGQYNLKDIPHVLMTISDVESDVGLLTEKLQVECLALENQTSQAELFIIIDNYDDLADDFSQTKGQLSETVKKLLRLVRQYGTRGVHLIAAGSFDSRHDLNRIIFSANYGIGLRTADPLNKLKVSRLPSNVRDKELEIGRGYIVKSGQLQTIQIATPYQDDDQPYDELDVAEMIPAALDQWIANIIAKYPNRQAAWADGSTTQAEAETTALPSENQEIMKILALLQEYMNYELNSPDKNGNQDTITAKFLDMNPTEWHNEHKLKSLLRDVWLALNPILAYLPTAEETPFKEVFDAVHTSLREKKQD